MITLKEITPGETVTIKKMNATGAIRKKLLDMGLTKNTEIHVRKVAPLGDPIEINIRGYELSLRKSEAANIEVEYVK